MMEVIIQHINAQYVMELEDVQPALVQADITKSSNIRLDKLFAITR